MDCTILNYKNFESGVMIGFCDLQVGGLTVRGCRLFCKNGDKVWFGWPSEKSQDKDGNDIWRHIVTASEPVMRHLQALIRPQIQALHTGKSSGAGPLPENSSIPQRHVDPRHYSSGNRQEDLGNFRRPSDTEDIPF